MRPDGYYGEKGGRLLRFSVRVFAAVFVTFPREVGVSLELGEKREHHLETELVLLLKTILKKYKLTLI